MKKDVTKMSRDDFTPRTKDILAKRVQYKCSICGKDTVGPNSEPEKITNIGEAAHITAAAKNGPRYDESLSEKQRESIDNAIWLCRSCHKIVDADPQKYTIDYLRECKKRTEEKAQNNLLPNIEYTIFRKKIFFCGIFILVIVCSLGLRIMKKKHTKLTLDDAEIRMLGTSLNIPEDMEITEYYLSEPWYWEGAGRWVVDLELSNEDGFLAGASIDPNTLDLMRQISPYYESVDDSEVNPIIHEYETFPTACRIEGIENYVSMCATYVDAIENEHNGFYFDIQNVGEKAIYFDDRNAVEVEVLKFIPLEELVAYNPVGGAEDWRAPTEWLVAIEPEIGSYYGKIIEDGNVLETSGRLLQLKEDDREIFNVHLDFDECGYYEINAKFHYEIRGTEYTYETGLCQVLAIPKDYDFGSYRQ